MTDFYYILAGILVGFTVGVTGVGGGSLMTPILISVLGVPANVAIGTDLIYASISKFCGSVVHSKKLNIVWSVVLWMSLGSLPASLTTTWVLRTFFHNANEYKSILTFVLAIMLILTGLSIIFRKQIEAFVNRIRTKHPKATTADLAEVGNGQYRVKTLKDKLMVMLMGVFLGVFVTLSSVGAGAFGIMVLILIFPQLPMIKIIGSDVAHAVILTMVAGLGHMVNSNLDTHILTYLLIGSIPAIIIGTLLSSRMPEHAIRKILGVTLTLLGINFMVNSLK